MDDDSKLTWEEIIKINSNDIDFTGKLKLHTFCTYFFDLASRHANHLQFGFKDLAQDNYYWVLSRLLVKIYKYPGFDHTIHETTWPKGINRLFALRDYSITDDRDNPIADATSAWLMIDKSSGRPIDANNFFKTEYYNSDRAALDIFPEKINPVKTTECSDIRQVYYSDIDINNHVNAGKYISWIQDLFPVEHYLENQIGMLQINYLSETRIGEKVQLFSESEDIDQKNFRIEGRIENTQAPAFRARIEWGKINN